jgi:hypothetical protein
VDGPVAVINADDFYGAHSFAALASFLQGENAPVGAKPAAGGLHTWAMVGYRLRNTLSESGAVARGVCQSDANGWLTHIVETLGIRPAGDGGQYTDAAGQTHTLPGDTPVSMNLWGFTPAIFAELRSQFVRFLEQHAGSLEAEFFLPFVIQEAIAAGRARVRVLPTPDAWCGITHPQDKPRVAAAIRALVVRGDYPEQLWT